MRFLCALLLITTVPSLSSDARAEDADERAAIDVVRKACLAIAAKEADEADDVARGLFCFDQFRRRVFVERALTITSADAARIDKLIDFVITEQMTLVVGHDTKGLTYRVSRGARKSGWLVDVVSPSRKRAVVTYGVERISGVARIVDVGTEAGLLGHAMRVGWFVAKPGTTPLQYTQSTMAAARRRHERVQAGDNIRVLILLMVEIYVEHGWPKLNGRNLVLSVVASGLLDTSKKAARRWLFSVRRKADPPPASRYAAVTAAALKKRTFPGLTSLAGRRNATKGYEITREMGGGRGLPLIANLEFEDVAVVGFSDGHVRVMTRRDLGLGPDDPLVLGEKSKSPILRQLTLD